MEFNKLYPGNCEHRSQNICFTEVCGFCYEEQLMNSKDRAPRNIKVMEVWEESKHMVVIRKAK